MLQQYARAIFFHSSYENTSKHKWVKVFKNEPSKICGRQPLKNLKCRAHITFFKGCLPQIFLGPFLNTLTQIALYYLVFTIDGLPLTKLSEREPH